MDWVVHFRFFYSRLNGVDAVTAIEVVEHLPPDVLAKFPQALLRRIHKHLRNVGLFMLLYLL